MGSSLTGAYSRRLFLLTESHVRAFADGEIAIRFDGEFPVLSDQGLDPVFFPILRAKAVARIISKTKVGRLISGFVDHRHLEGSAKFGIIRRIVGKLHAAIDRDRAGRSF